MTLYRKWSFYVPAILSVPVCRACDVSVESVTAVRSVPVCHTCDVSVESVTAVRSAVNCL